MSKRRSKPALSLASVMHKITPIYQITNNAASGDTAGSGKKRKRSVLISEFHQLQRRKEDLEKSRKKLSADEYQRQAEAIESEIRALGGLETYQNLSIAGHSNSKYHAFNSAHWIVDVLAECGFGLESFKGKHRSSGATIGNDGTILANNQTLASTSSSTNDDEKKLLKRQKERERKRAKKRQQREAEQAAAAAAAAASSKGNKKKGDDKKDATKKKKDAEDSDADEDDDAGDDEEEEGHGLGSSLVSSVPKPIFTPKNRLKLLDVGAITNHFFPYASLIDCTAIDLNPQHPSVKKQDFFHLPFDQMRHSFDVVVLSLVLNFVGDRFKRGEMIQRSVHLLKTTGHGRLFIVLPSACLKNSRWMNHESFVLKCMKPLGLTLGKFKYSTKLAFFEFIREEVKPKIEEEEDEVQPEDGENEEEQEEEEGPSKKKKKAASGAATPASKVVKRKGFQPAGIVLEGETRNNFSIAWRADLLE